MIYTASFLGPWLIIAIAFGGYMGWRFESGEPQGPVAVGGFRNALIALAVAFLLAVFGLFAGRAALWWESAVLFCIAYLAGALAGGAIKRARGAA